jgi:hypothetical protein
MGHIQAHERQLKGKNSNVMLWRDPQQCLKGPGGIWGQAVGDVGTASDLQILDRLDAASAHIDPLAQKYDQYLSRLSGLNKMAGAFLADQWYVSQADYDLVMKVNGLPLKLGSLSASRARMEEVAASLKSLGAGASVAVDTADKVVTFAEATHAVLSTAEMAGGGERAGEDRRDAAGQGRAQGLRQSRRQGVGAERGQRPGG